MFKSTASFPEQALVVMFDLEGFSRFFSQPDVHTYVPNYLNHVLEAVSIALLQGGETYYAPWPEEDKANGQHILPPLPEPIHTKFLGDGMLYIWRYSDFTKNNLTSLIIRLWNLKTYFYNVAKKSTDDVPVIDIPERIRFGVSAGSVYRLNYSRGKKEEYIGYSINLASRLQGYCRELGFVVSARLAIPQESINKGRFKKVIATKIKGFPREIVIVDEAEYDALESSLKSDLFEDI